MFEGIHEYFARLLFICCSCIICELVSEYAHSKSSSVSQALNVVCCLCVCVTVFSFFTGGSDIFPEAENILKSAENAGSAYSAQTGSDALIEQSRIAA